VGVQVPLRAPSLRSLGCARDFAGGLRRPPNGSSSSPPPGTIAGSSRSLVARTGKTRFTNADIELRNRRVPNCRFLWLRRLPVAPIFFSGLCGRQHVNCNHIDADNVVPLLELDLQECLENGE
jgi:hypothetical protein